MTLEFDPNKKNSPVMPVAASYIPSRRPEFKVHRTIGQAKSALSYHKHGIVYEWKDEKWVEIDRAERPSKCAHCGNPLASGWHHYGYELYRHPAKPAYKRPHVCERCYYNHFSGGAQSPIPVEWVGQVNPIA